MAKKPSTAEEKRHMGRVAALGCIIESCQQPANVHHCGTHMGGGRDNMKVIPLCHLHHTSGSFSNPSIHPWRKKFEEMYGTEEELLKIVDDILNGENNDK